MFLEPESCRYSRESVTVRVQTLLAPDVFVMMVCAQSFVKSETTGRTDRKLCKERKAEDILASESVVY